MPDTPAFNFTDDSRVAIVQARFESLASSAGVLGPDHLVLGVVKTAGQELFDRLFPDESRYQTLCETLASTPERAPVVAEEVVYSEAAHAAIAGAIKAAGAGRPILPVHLLIGIHGPERAGGGPAPRSAAASALDAAGLDLARLERLAADE
ncbi:MAG TPA: hypothetical protein VFS28_03355 [Gemmatimonadales bacterium]|nr:hypothetical protein [Gemmatimonadales bacterium]